MVAYKDVSQTRILTSICAYVQTYLHTWPKINIDNYRFIQAYICTYAHKSSGTLTQILKPTQIM